MASRPSLRESAPWKVLDGFGASVLAVSRHVRPTSLESLAALLQQAREESMSVVCRGSGRSYGDASLNAGALAIDMRGLSRILSWDRERGIADLESGATIGDLWRRSLPEGWWPAVVPGTMFPTMGGCIAMNIHGKNCYRAGPFGDHVLELDLMTADGQVRTLSPEQDGELFRSVIAGLGLLGVVTRVRLQLKRVHSGRLRVRPIRTPTLDAMFDALAARTASADYLVGWIDCFASGDALGRGIVHEAHHLREGEDPKGAYTLAVEHQDLPHAIFGVPRTLVWRFLQPFTNDVGLRLINQVKYLLPEPTERDGTFFDSHASFSFLLDYVPDWRRAYGPSGFIQYQLFLPDGTAREAMREALSLCVRRGIVSYLGVFKRHRPDSYLLSHGLDGWSLALDFPVPRREPERLWALTRDLTRIVLEAGGSFYPAKDQVVDAKSFAQAFGDRYTKFRALKRTIDPGGLFAGDQARRLELV